MDRAWEHCRSKWPLALAAITVGGLILRAVYSQVTAPPALVGDPGFFHGTAQALADGHGYFSMQSLGIAGHTAERPPLYSMLVAGIAWLGGTDEGTQRLVASLITGAAFVPVLGYLGRRVAGVRVGLIAAGVAAVCPTLIVAQASGESEALFGVFVALALLGTYQFIERTDVRRGALLGLWIGLATLSRSDAILLVALPLIALVRATKPRPWLGAGTAVAITVLVLSPWVIRNWSVFGRPTLSTNFGALVAATNCPEAYYGHRAGGFPFKCVAAPRHGSELDRSDAMMRRGLDYARDHASRLPYLAAVRFVDVWGLRRPRYEFAIYAASNNTRRLELATYYPFLMLAVIGVVVLRRRRLIFWPLLIPAVITSLIAMSSWGTARFRHGSEVAMVVAAAVALDAIALAVRRR